MVLENKGKVSLKNLTLKQDDTRLFICNCGVVTYLHLNKREGGGTIFKKR